MYIKEKDEKLNISFEKDNDNDIQLWEDENGTHAKIGNNIYGDGTTPGDTIWERGSGANSAQLKSTGCSAEGVNSVAVGLNTVAASDYSHAEGYASKTAINPDDPDGYGSASHAEGTGTIAKGTSSHAEGGGSLAIGRDSHAEGNSTTTGGDASHAEGNWTITNNFAEHAEGTFNLSNMASSTFGDAGNTLHSIGIGKATGELKDDRKNAVEVMQNGDVYIIGVNNYDGTNFSDVEPIQTNLNKANTSLQPDDIVGMATEDWVLEKHYSFISKTGNKLDLTIDSSTFVMTLKLLTEDGDILDTKEVDLPLEEMVIDGSYNSENKSIILTLKSGTTVEIPVGDLVSDLVSNETFTSKVAELEAADDLHEQQIISQADAINNNIIPALSSISSDLSNHREAIQMNATNIEDVYNYVVNDVETKVDQNTSTLINFTTSKQDTLVSGTNIKTINGESILDSGNISTLNGKEVIDDLTGYTWVGNSVMNPTDLRTKLGGNYTIYVNFTNQSYSLTGIRVEAASNNVNFVYMQGSGKYTVYKGSTSSWSGDAWKTIHFTGDCTDANHRQDLIEWLMENGTLTPPSGMKPIIEVVQENEKVYPKTTWNAVEDKPIFVNNNNVYIIGIGGFDGTNYSEALSLQEVINNLTPSK